jgi:hypothetical protein
LNGRNVAIALVVGLLIGAGVTYAFGGQDLGSKTTVTSISTTISTVTVDLTQQVSDAYLIHLLDITGHNITDLVDDYTNDATLGFFTNSPLGGLGGGAYNVTQFFNEVMYLGHAHPTVDFANESYATTVSSDGIGATVHANLTVYGESLVAPANPSAVYVENAALTIDYVHIGGHWLISNEYWYFVNSIDGCQSFSTPPCSTLLSSPNWSEYILGQ